MSDKNEIIKEIRRHDIAHIERHEESITLSNFEVVEENYDLFLDYIEQTEGQIVE